MQPFGVLTHGVMLPRRPPRDPTTGGPKRPDRYAAAMTELIGPGAQVGPYRIVRPLGEGAMGIVFEAVPEPEGQTVALKVFRPELSSGEGFRQRFAHEARPAGGGGDRDLLAVPRARAADSR